MSKNPDWTSDELILALDLYFKVNPLRSKHDHPAVAELSELLNSLPFHPRSKRENSFRNPIGVYMTLRTFLKWDPSYQGKGLGGGKLGKIIWDRYSSDIERLSELANSIRRCASTINCASSVDAVVDEEVFLEGRILTATHRGRERNLILVTRKKKAVLEKTGTLACEICDFDFQKTYGLIGKEFAECHHLTPLAQLGRNKGSKLSDLAVLCANCHRMIHRTSPIRSIHELQTAVNQSRHHDKVI